MVNALGFIPFILVDMMSDEGFWESLRYAEDNYCQMKYEKESHLGKYVVCIEQRGVITFMYRFGKDKVIECDLKQDMRNQLLRKLVSRECLFKEDLVSVALTDPVFVDTEMEFVLHSDDKDVIVIRFTI